MRFEAHGYNHEKSPHMILHNPNDESVTVKLPAGALFASVKNGGGQKRGFERSNGSACRSKGNKQGVVVDILRQQQQGITLQTLGGDGLCA